MNDEPSMRADKVSMLELSDELGDKLSESASHTSNSSRANMPVLDPKRAPFAQVSDADATLRALGRVHFIGIGGAGMSVLAMMLHERGVSVSGSDQRESEHTEQLRALGVPVAIGQAASQVAGAGVVVYSSAIKPSNPEIVAAHAAGIAIVHRSDILALLLSGHRSVAVAGAHGKTTTTSMLVTMLRHRDPSFAIGGSLQGAHGEVLDGGYAGSGDVMIAEADESDGSFLKYRPDVAVITNAEADHLDHYGDAAHYEAAFVQFASHAKRAVVMCFDDAGAQRVLMQLPQDVLERVVVYSALRSSSDAETQESRSATGNTMLPQACEEFLTQHHVPVVRIGAESEHAGSGVEQFTLSLPAVPVLGVAAARTVLMRLRVPGLHNARNATAALLAAMALGEDPLQAAQAVEAFRGAVRRFELKGEARGVQIVDDYAHHPTEITALLQAARRRYPQARLHVIFQPHLFSRTQIFAHEFARALHLADDVIITGIYPAREAQQDFPQVSANTIVKASLADAATADNANADITAATNASVDATEQQSARGKHYSIEAIDDMHEAARVAASRAQAGDVIFTVGAGSITAVGADVLAALQAEAHAQLPSADSPARASANSPVHSADELHA